MREPSSAAVEPQLFHDGSNLASIINSLLTGGDSEAINAIIDSLHRAIPTLKGLSTPPTDNNGASREIRFVLSGNERPVLTIPAAEVSDGAMFLTAFLVLAHWQFSNVLLIEEPETGLHPERIETVVKLLRQLTTGELGYPPRQIILTTHSPLLLNFVDPKEVRIFQRGDGEGTRVTPMDKIPDIDRLQKDFATGELWHMLGEKQLVEGPSH